MVADIIYSNRVIATWVKCHLVAVNPSGIYHDYRVLPIPSYRMPQAFESCFTLRYFKSFDYC